MSSVTNKSSKRNPGAARAEKFTADNQACAEVILSDPTHYPDLMQAWARLVVDRSAPTERQWRLCA